VDRPFIDLLLDGDPLIREAAVESLGMIGGKDTTSGLLFALRDEDDLVRTAAIDALSTLNTAEALRRSR